MISFFMFGVGPSNLNSGSDHSLAVWAASFPGGGYWSRQCQRLPYLPVVVVALVVPAVPVAAPVVISRLVEVVVVVSVLPQLVKLTAIAAATKDRIVICFMLLECWCLNRKRAAMAR
jgi:hypothetical protein